MIVSIADKNYVPGKATIKHVDAVLKLMTAHTGDDRFEDSLNAYTKKERRDITMCEVLDRVENRGIKKAEKKVEKKAGLSLSYRWLTAI